MTPDEIYMSRAIQLAKLAQGRSNPNPLVGAVIVHNNRIIGEGFHEGYGKPHAEVNAINSVEHAELLPESTIYVTLEPCSHFGKTPPCANLLISNKIRRVVIGTQDPNPLVAGKGIDLLRNAGITVELGTLEDVCNALNPGFMTFHREKRPYVHLKWAESADAYLDQRSNPVKISEVESDLLVHDLRNTYHAILVGKNTAQRDNPSLSCRNPGGINPIRIVLDSNLELNPELQVFDQTVKTYVLNLVKEEVKDNLSFVQLENMQADTILQVLWKLNIVSVLIEGGAKTLQSFIDKDLWDECLIIRNQTKLIQGTAAPIINQKPVSCKKLLNDTHFNYKKVW